MPSPPAGLERALTDESPLPRRLGRYWLLERLPVQGMVQPWLARRDGGVELVELSHLHADVAGHPAAQGRFRRLAALAGYLDHPHIVRTLETGEEGDTFCVVSEPVHGITLEPVLDAALARGVGLPLPVFRVIALRLLAALDHAHRAADGHGRSLGIVHRHLAPRSVWAGFTGELRLGDFTVAFAEVGDFRTAPGMGVGTAGYMSPEQVRAEPLDARSDLYAVSVLLWELASGRRAVAEAPLIEMLRAVSSTPVPALERPDAPPELAAVLARGLEKDPGQRWPSARDYRLALDAALVPFREASEDAVLAAFLREGHAEAERAVVSRLRRVRALRVPEAARPRALSHPPRIAPEPEEPISDEPPEPSVMTMPGVPAADFDALPEVAAPLPRAPSVRSPSRGEDSVSLVRRVPARPGSGGTGFGLVMALLALVVALGTAYVLIRDRGPLEPSLQASTEPVAPSAAPSPRSSSPEPAVSPRRRRPPARVAEPAVASSSPRARSEPARSPVGRGQASSVRSSAGGADEVARSAPPAQASATAGPAAAEAVDPLKRRLEALELSEDPREFIRLHARLVGRAEQISGAKRLKALRILDAARRALDATALREAYELMRTP